MDWRKWTKVFIIVALVAIVAYDVVAMVYGHVQATISRRMWFWSKDYPMVPFLGGVLCGHLWWAQEPKPNEKLQRRT